MVHPSLADRRGCGVAPWHGRHACAPGAPGAPGSATAAARPGTPIPETIVEPGEISLSATRYVVLPGRRSVEIEVQRSGGAAGDVSFRWWTQGSGARPGRDYVSVSSKLARVPDGVDTLRLKVPILTNPSRKHTELFYVAIEKPGGGASLGSIRRATVFIVPP